MYVWKKGSSLLPAQVRSQRDHVSPSSHLFSGAHLRAGVSPVTRSISSPTSGQGACLMLPDVHQQKGGEAAVLSPPPVPDECLCLATEELLAHTPFYRLLFLILQDWVFQFWFSCPLSASLPFRTALGMVAGAWSCITTQIWNCPFLHSPRCLSVLVLSHIRA